MHIYTYIHPPTLGGVLRFPPGPHLRSSRHAPTRRFAKNRNLRGLGKRFQAPAGLGPKPWGPQAPWRPGAQAPGAWIPPLYRLTSYRLLPEPLGGVGWFPKAELYSIMRGGVPVFAPAFQPQAPENLANKPLSPASRQPSRVKNSKNAPVLIGS